MLHITTIIIKNNDLSTTYIATQEAFIVLNKQNSCPVVVYGCFKLTFSNLQSCSSNPIQLILENNFEVLINSYINQKVGIDDTFLSVQLADLLKTNLLNLVASQQLIQAGTGNTRFTVNKKWRGDEIFWLDKSHNDATENLFFVLIDAFISYLNATCYTGITGYEFHYTLYNEGTFYKKHFDQFQNNSDRAFSMILYLNSDWEIAHGGELCLALDQEELKIAPINRKCVFFKSDEMEHEVLITNAPRYSITGWLKVGS